MPENTITLNQLTATLFPILMMNNSGSNNMIMLCLFQFITYVVSNFHSICEHFSSFMNKGHVSISFVSTYNTTGQVTSRSFEYRAIMHHIVQQLLSGKLCNHNICIIDDNERIVFTCGKKIYLTNDIYLTYNTQLNNASKDEYVVVDTIKLCNSRNDYAALKQFVKDVENDCTIYNMYSNKQLSLFCLKKMGPPSIKYSQSTLDPNKTFDNIFIQEKQILIDKLDYFKNSRELCARIGKQYTLAFLFYGQPGCGKTSCIKAIATYLNRHIIRVNVQKVRTADDFERLFLSKEINYYTIPLDQRLYVFEEVDCGEWGEMLMSRIQIPKRKDDKPTDTILLDLITKQHSINYSDKSSSSDEPTEKEFSLTLSNVLETLDGLHNMDGRMCIFTTNHPERIDPAILRPGRIDHIIEFKKMKKENINALYTAWFGHSIPLNIYQCMQDEQFTQADVGCLFSNDNMTYIHNVLCGVDRIDSRKPVTQCIVSHDITLE